MMYIKLYGKYYDDIPWYSCLSWEYGGIFHGDTMGSYKPALWFGFAEVT